jgi:hypothetical protein
MGFFWWPCRLATLGFIACSHFFWNILPNTFAGYIYYSYIWILGQY